MATTMKKRLPDPTVSVSNDAGLVGMSVRIHVGQKDWDAFEKAANLLFDQKFRMVEFYPSMPPTYFGFEPELDVYQVSVAMDNSFQICLKSWIGLEGPDVGKEYAYVEADVSSAFLGTMAGLARHHQAGSAVIHAEAGHG